MAPSALRASGSSPSPGSFALPARPGLAVGCEAGFAGAVALRDAGAEAPVAAYSSSLVTSQAAARQIATASPTRSSTRGRPDATTSSPRGCGVDGLDEEFRLRAPENDTRGDS